MRDKLLASSQYESIDPSLSQAEHFTRNRVNRRIIEVFEKNKTQDYLGSRSVRHQTYSFFLNFLHWQDNKYIGNPVEELELQASQRTP